MRLRKALAKAKRVMYNITHAWWPADGRAQADTGSRAPGRSADAGAQVTCAARGHRDVGSASTMSGRMDFSQLNDSRAGAEATASHKRGARDFRSAVRRVRVQASAEQAAASMRHQCVAPITRKTRSTFAHRFSFDRTVRRLPSVASGRSQHGENTVFNRAGSTLADARFGLESGVHPTAIHCTTTFSRSSADGLPSEPTPYSPEHFTYSIPSP